MNMKKNKKIKKLIIIFIIFLMLLNIVTIRNVFAFQTTEDFGEYLRVMKYDGMPSDTNVANIDMGTESEEYKKLKSSYDNYYSKFNYQSFEEYAEQYKNDASFTLKYGIGAYNDKFVIEASKNYTGAKKSVSPIYQEYINAKSDAYKAAYPQAFSEEDMNEAEAKQKAADEKDKELLKKSELTEEEKARAKVILKEKEDKTGWLEDLFNRMLSGVVNFIAGTGDVVISFLQDKMLVAAPTAVARRTNTQEMHDLLSKRGDDSFIYGFAKNAESGVAYEFSEYPIPFIYYSPAAIFANEIPVLDINFFDEDLQVKSPYVSDSNNEISQEVIEESKNMLKATELSSNHTKQECTKIEDIVDNLANDPKQGNAAYILQSVVSKWYVALRNITILGQLIVLVYIGIRILISASGEETSKYKKMLMNWVLGVVLVLVIHYIMMFLVVIIQKIISMFGNIINIQGDTLMNKIRIEIVHYSRIVDISRQFGYALIYLVMAWYVIMFTWQYIKRVIYMAFLTIIAPLVALTYPLDKLKDGQSQAFNMWLKEYIYNLLLQPVHLLLYVILVNSAIELATTNVLYAVVAIGFMLQAEKFLKKMFDIKAHGGAGEGSFAAGAAFTSLMKNSQNLSKNVTKAINGGGSSNSQGGNDGGTSGNGDGRTADSNIPKLFFNNSGNKLQIQSRPKKIPSSMYAINGNRRRLLRFPAGLLGFKPKQKYRVIQGSSRIGGAIPLIVATSANNNQAMNNNNQVMNNNQLPTNSNVQNLDGNNANNNLNNNENVALNGNQRTFTRGVINGAKLVHARYRGNGVRKIAKLAAKTMGAGSLGMLGVAAGLASDDFSNVLKYGALGVAGGAMLGGSVVDNTAAMIGAGKQQKDTFQEGYYGDEYNDKILNPRLDREWEKSYDTQQWLMTKYGVNWGNKKEEALKLRSFGITDKKEIEKAIEMKDENHDLSIEQVGVLFKTFKNITRSDLMNEKRRENIVRKARKITKNDDKGTEQIMNLLDKKYGVYYKPELREVNKPNLNNNLDSKAEGSVEERSDNKDIPLIEDSSGNNKKDLTSKDTSNTKTSNRRNTEKAVKTTDKDSKIVEETKGTKERRKTTLEKGKEESEIRVARDKKDTTSNASGILKKDKKGERKNNESNEVKEEIREKENNRTTLDKENKTTKEAEILQNNDIFETKEINENEERLNNLLNNNVATKETKVEDKKRTNDKKRKKKEVETIEDIIKDNELKREEKFHEDNNKDNIRFNKNT